jgi:hypothetical protein
LLCVDRDVVGTPFYVMDKVEGRVFATHALPGIAPAERGAMYASMARTLAALHRVDPAAVGLADYGRPGNYFARQIARWSKQWAAVAHARQSGARQADRVAACAHPRRRRDRICHGDYRIGNLMFAPRAARGRGARLGALDPRPSARGPGFNAMAWETRPDEYGGLRGLDLVDAGHSLAARLRRDLPCRVRPARRDRAVPLRVRAVPVRGDLRGHRRTRGRGQCCVGRRGDAGKLGPAFARRAVEIAGA